MANKIEAKDCSPFQENCSVIGDNNRTKEFGLLAKFVGSIVPISIFGNDLEDEDADSKLAYSPFENLERVWKAGRYVGATRIEDTTIEISPRFGDEWLKYILGDVFHFKIVQSGAAESERMPINDIMRRVLWHLWVRKFALADQYGLPRQVVKRSHQGLQIRGHLNVRKSLLPLYTKSQVVSEYREKDIDDAICRIVYKAYCILVNRQFNKTQVPSQIQDSLNSLYGFYQGRPISVTANDYNNIHYKSVYLSWKPLVDFSWQIIQRDSLFKQKGMKDDNFSVFFDMAEIWEAFLRKKLREGLEDWRVWSAEECKLNVYKDTFFGRKIIPDIVLERVGEDGKSEFVIFDAKYKLMRGEKEDVDRTDFFQIHTYIQFFQHTKGRVLLGGLLYPLLIDIDDSNISKFHSRRMYGIQEGSGDNTLFIVDGVFCPEPAEKLTKEEVEKQRKDLEDNVNKLINRIKKLIG